MHMLVHHMHVWQSNMLARRRYINSYLLIYTYFRFALVHVTMAWYSFTSTTWISHICQWNTKRVGERVHALCLLLWRLVMPSHVSWRLCLSVIHRTCFHVLLHAWYDDISSSGVHAYECWWLMWYVWCLIYSARAKMEISTKTRFNPIRQDIKKGQLR